MNEEKTPGDKVSRGQYKNDYRSNITDIQNFSTALFSERFFSFLVILHRKKEQQELIEASKSGESDLSPEK